MLSDSNIAQKTWSRIYFGIWEVWELSEAGSMYFMFWDEWNLPTMHQDVWVYMSYSVLFIPFILATPLSMVFANTFLDCVALFYVYPILASSLRWVAAPGWESVFIVFHLDFSYFCWSTYPLVVAYTLVYAANSKMLTFISIFTSFYDAFSFSILLAQQSLIVGYREQEKTRAWYFFGQANIPTEFAL